LGIGHVLLSGPLVPVNCQQRVNRNASTAAVSKRHVVLRKNICLLGRHTKPANRFVFILP